jgi:hypothetical protein
MSTSSVRPELAEGLPARETSPGPARRAWPSPFAFVHRRFHAWWQSRLPFTDSVTLTQRNVYILPTRPGWMMGVTLLVLLVASINYQLSLGYLLTFLLAGSALVGMHVCHGTLRGLSMNLAAPHAQYVGATAAFEVKLTNTRRTVRHGIGLSVLNPQDVDAEKGRERHWAWTDVPAQGSSVVQVAFTPPKRGLHRLPTLTAETRFPLGTFRVWTIWRPAAQVLVYPAPEIHPPPLPPGEPRSGGAAAALRAQNSGEFDGVRGYRRGDPMKLVVWKKAAKDDGQGTGWWCATRSRRSGMSCGWTLRRPVPPASNKSFHGCVPGCCWLTSCRWTMVYGCLLWRSSPPVVRHTSACAWRRWRYVEAFFCPTRAFFAEGCWPGVARRQLTFLLLRQKKSKQKKRRPWLLRPSASLRATCGARSSRGLAKLASLKQRDP